MRELLRRIAWTLAGRGEVADALTPELRRQIDGEAYCTDDPAAIASTVSVLDPATGDCRDAAILADDILLWTAELHRQRSLRRFLRQLRRQERRRERGR